MSGEYVSDRRELSPAERDVLQLFANGLSLRQVAARRGRSCATIKNQINAVIVRLGAHDRTGAVAQGFRQGLVH